jgi:hypothetical protein
VRKPRVSRPRRERERTVRNGSGMLTLDHRDMWVGEEDMFSSVACCGLGASLTRRLMTLDRRRMLATSCRTELG